MKHILLAAPFALLPFAASAQDITISGGVAVATSYDLTADAGAEAEYPLSFYLQAEKNGFYAQLWFGMLANAGLFAAAPDKIETDIIIGWAGALSDKVEIDLSYAAYFLDDSGYSTSELIAALGFSATDALSLGLEVGYDIEVKESYVEASAGYAITDKWSLGAMLGHETAAGSNYWELGVTYAVTEEVALNILFEDDNTAGNDGVLTFTMSYDF